jgi:hypothetical protein
MDIRHHLGILMRWRVVLVVGFIAATLIAILVTFKPGGAGLEWRAEAVYLSTSKILVTQPGFPTGRATLPGADPSQPAPSNLQTFAPSSRFTELAVVYSYLAQSDEVRRRITPKPLQQQITVNTVPNPATNEPLPLLEVGAMSKSATGSRELNRAAISALRGYLDKNVAENNVPASERVTLQVLNPPKQGKLIAGHSLTRSVIAWLLLMVGTLIAIYVLENLRVTAGSSREDPFFPEGLDADLLAGARWEPVELDEPTTHPSP